MPEAGWNDSNLSAKQIEAKVQERQVAALKRERALAYARTQQVWKSFTLHPLQCMISVIVDMASGVDVGEVRWHLCSS